MSSSQVQSAGFVEIISADERPLAYIVRGTVQLERTTFVTPDSSPLQLGFVVYPGGAEIARHVHLPLERHLVGTSEVILVREGHCDIDVYDDARALVASRELRTGDLVLLVGGGHGFRLREDTVLLEIKQGPYTGLAEKERF
jgi:hypothetical protein